MNTPVANELDSTLAPVRLTQLRTGDCARLHAADLAACDCEILYALGFANQCTFRLCKAGSPWIVQVRTTRIGLSEAVARQLLVIPEATEGHH